VKKKGVFIAVEGIDGAGKTTQACMLVKKLRQMGYEAAYTTEPTYGRVGDLLRLHVSKQKPRAPLYEALLFAADRFEHVKREIQPKLRRGLVVVSDRYLYSSLAYQGAAGVSLPWLREVNFFAPKPDLTFYIDISPAKSLKRKAGKVGAYESLSYQKKVRKIYLDMAEEEGFTVLEGEKGAEELHRDMLSKVLKLLPKPRKGGG
jgi:dTMP kinase